MSPRNVYSKTLWDARRSLVAWMVGTAAIAAVYAGFYPQLAGGGMAEAIANFPQAIKDAFRLDDISSAAGYLQSTTFGLLVPLLVMINGIVSGTRALAGDEEAGHLDVLLAHPLSRTRLVLHRFAAVATGAVLTAALVFLAMLAIRDSARLDTVSIGGFAAQALNVALLGCVFAALALAIGAISGRRALTLGITTAIGVLAYAATTVGPQVGAAWTRTLSPFHYYSGGEPLKHGLDWAGSCVLAVTCVVLVAVGVWALRGRDLRS
ncbi:ABC transporter permease subunit [Actinocrispum wychmicini]|uniref:ABC-2 type transport system permease protein n=1 Tax=Actinocrispum wychmicini TaxID=1213861 RepID=A0A4R2JGZ0_9PSEU|nr:ABC transporter permease subunit [Actinocrispum wychmicini]TCO58314.1 ABC-2 type transport system permease protein [Actinocrispum wychmicini]